MTTAYRVYGKAVSREEWERTYGAPPCECDHVDMTADVYPPVHVGDTGCGRRIPDGLSPALVDALDDE